MSVVPSDNSTLTRPSRTLGIRIVGLSLLCFGVPSFLFAVIVSRGDVDSWQSRTEYGSISSWNYWLGLSLVITTGLISTFTCMRLLGWQSKAKGLWRPRFLAGVALMFISFFLVPTLDRAGYYFSFAFFLYLDISASLFITLAFWLASGRFKVTLAILTAVFPTGSLFLAAFIGDRLDNSVLGGQGAYAAVLGSGLGVICGIWIWESEKRRLGTKLPGTYRQSATEA